MTSTSTLPLEQLSSLSDDHLKSEEALSVLVIDDEAAVGQGLKAVLEEAGYLVHVEESAVTGLAQLDRQSFNFILVDLMMPEMDGMSFIKAAQEKNFLGTVILMSAYATVDIALQAIKEGAYDYIPKPFNADEILLTLKKAQERERLKSENAKLRAQIGKKQGFTKIISQNEEVLGIFDTIKKISNYKTTVSIYGESGTGKELIAKAIHENSTRRNKQFVAVNCGAIPENLLESELFGHKKGAFTDATKDKKGLFEEAEGGTLFLDEIGELPGHLQVKLLRVLQEHEIRPVGSNEISPIDVRLLTATLKDLENDVLEGRFREDLYYRLNVVNITLPPLRARTDDIPLLVRHFLKKHKERLNASADSFTTEVLKALKAYDWPGNIRELENCIERAMILCEGNQIQLEHLPKTIFQSRSSNAGLELSYDDLSIKSHSRKMEKHLISLALKKTKGNRTHAAKLLEISHRTLLYKLKEYDIDEGTELSK